MANIPKYKYVLFDWDGTLLNSIPAWIAGIRKVLPTYNLGDLTEREIAVNILNAFEDIQHLYPSIPDLTRFRNEIYATDDVINLHLSGLHEGVEDTLKFLHNKNIPLGIVTTSNRANLEAALSHHRLERYFDKLITREDVINRKPHPEPVIKCLQALDCDVKHTVYVGDSHHDTGSGRAAGVKTVLHYPLLNERYFDMDFVNTSGADYIIKKLRELHEWV